MRSFFIVIYYTIKQTIKKKSFWVTNIIMASILFLIFALISNLEIPELTMSNFTSSDDRGILKITSEMVYSSNTTETQDVDHESDIENPKDKLPKVLFVDKSNLFDTYLDSLYETEYNFVIDNNMHIDSVKKEVTDETLYAAVIIKEVEGTISFDYIVLEDSSYNRGDIELISNLLKQIQSTKLLTELNMSEENITIINSPINHTISTLQDNTIIDNATLISMTLAFILFFAIYFYSYSVSSSVASEKTSRVIETLITSTSPKHVIIGKTIGMGILGLLQLIFLAFICVISYRLFISSSLSFLSELIKSVDINTINIILLSIYFVLGYTIFAFLNAITGATVSKPEDVQMANLPISLISVVAFVLTFFALDPNNDSTSKFATMFPFSSPFSMPGHILTGYVNTPEIIASLLILITTVVLLAFISIRIYSVAILHYGNRLKIRDLFNMFLKIK